MTHANESDNGRESDSGATAQRSPPAAQLPHMLPARMINEFVYCPRLFWYEHVEGIFVHNQETIEGSIGHANLDAKEEPLPSPEEAAEVTSRCRARSVSMGSERLGVVAKMDLVEIDGGKVIPVDYKRGRPQRTDDDDLTAWPTDRVQIGVQALILRDHGYTCDHAVIYYAQTRQRVRVEIDQELIAWTEQMIQSARELAQSSQIPPPLENSPKCPRCSLVGVCLPDETSALRESAAPHADLPQQPGSQQELAERQSNEIRRLLPARDDLKPLYLNSQGLSVGISGAELKIREKGKVVEQVRLKDISHVNVMGNIQLTTQAIQALCSHEKPIAYFSSGGWFYGTTRGLEQTNIMLRREQFRRADDAAACLEVSRSLVAGKIRNQRTLLMRNHVEPPQKTIAQMKRMANDALSADSMESLLGIEGNAARLYFESFPGMIKVGSGRRSDQYDTNYSSDAARASSAESSESTSNQSQFWSDQPDFVFKGRNRRPPRDPVNALLSLAYSLLAKDCTIIAHIVGFDPYLGFFHQPRYGRPSLALDLMEPFRPLIADSAVLTAINTRMVTPEDFLRAGDSVALTNGGRKKFFHAYEQRMDALVTHPLFGYRVSYRRVLEIQTRLLARVLTGEMLEYPVFVTR